MRRLAWCAVGAGLATLFHCGGTGDVTIEGVGDDGGGDGTTIDATGGKDATGSGDASGKDGSAGGDATSSGGEGGGATEGGSLEGGADGGHDAAGEAGSGDSGSGEGGTSDGGVTEGGGPEGGAQDAAGSDAAPEAGGDGGGAADGAPGDAGGDGGPTDAAANDTGAGDAGSDAGSTDAGDGGVTNQVLFRVGALMALPGSVDFCWQQGIGAWNGPVMLGWGVSARLAYQQVSEYVAVPDAATNVRIVNGTATDCNTPIAQTAFVPTSASAAYFVAEFAQGNVAAQAKAFLDERTTSTSTNTKLRAIDAAITELTAGGPIGQPVDFYLGGGATTSLFDDVAFGFIAAPGNGVDVNGYLSHDPLNNADLRVRLHTSQVDLLDAPGFGTTAGHVYSLFTVGLHNLSSQNTAPMKLLVCDDSAPPSGHLSACTATGTQL